MLQRAYGYRAADSGYHESVPVCHITETLDLQGGKREGERQLLKRSDTLLTASDTADTGQRSSPQCVLWK